MISKSATNLAGVRLKRYNDQIILRGNQSSSGLHFINHYLSMSNRSFRPHRRNPRIRVEDD